MSETTNESNITSRAQTRVIDHLAILAFMLLGTAVGAKTSWWLGLNYGQMLLGAIIGGSLMLALGWFGIAVVRAVQSK